MKQTNRAAVRAWRQWLEADEGERCNNPDTMQLHPIQYDELTARLRAAFDAGFSAGQEQERAQAPLFFALADARPASRTKR